jgi:putative transcriptional regulator
MPKMPTSITPSRKPASQSEVVGSEAAPPVRQSLARLDAADPSSEPAPSVLHPGLPPPLNAYDIGPRRFVHPGVRWRRLTLPESPDANVIMLKVAAGRRVPRHGHSGTEYTRVLKGSFANALGHFRAGDCVEVDEGIDHQPVVDTGGECVCLSAAEGRVRPSGWIGRLLQPLIGM